MNRRREEGRKEEGKGRRKEGRNGGGWPPLFVLPDENREVDDAVVVTGSSGPQGPVVF